MSVDVVVVTYNSADLLPAALEALPAHAHIVVVDNASADSSVEVATRLGVEVVENPVNAGFGAAANLGARGGASDLVLFLNPDARVEAPVLDELCRRMRDEPTLAVLSPSLRRPDGTDQRIWWPIPSASSAWREALGLHRLTSDRRRRGFVIGACFLVRRSAFEAMGGFDTSIWLYGEETELCRRLQDAGWRVELAADLRGSHVGGASGQGLEDVVFEHFERGGEHVVAKHDGTPALVSYRLANLVGSSLRAVLPGSSDRRTLHRARSRRLRRTLVSHPASVRLDSPATAAPGEGVVVCSLEAWDEVWRRNQFLVSELLELEQNLRVLFVEPPFDWVHELRRRSARGRQRGLRPLETDARIVRFEPGKVWPRVLGRFADRSLRRQVERAADQLGFVAPSLWVNDPHYAGLTSSTGWPALYDITDDWVEAGDGARATGRVWAYERQLFRECRSVVVCSDGLAASRRKDRPDLVVVPNAVDVQHFTRPQIRPADLPGGPVAVYVGTLHEDRLDLALVEQLAAAAPDLAVVLVGPDSLSPSAHERLAVHQNVHLLGRRPYAEVPAYLQHADAVVVPHVVSTFTESLDPIKAYECLAVGRPTVATQVAGFRDLPEPIRAVPRDRFVDEVVRVVGDRPVESRPAEVPTWADRAEVFAASLFDAAERRGPLRVVFLDHCARLSGAELALARMLPALQAQGVDAHVILGEHGPLEEKLRQTGATVEVLALDERVGETHRDEVRVGRLGLSRARAAWQDTMAVRRRLEELQPDLVHTNSLKAALYGGVAGRLARVPVLWHVRDRIADDYLPRPAVRLVRLLAATLPKAVIANSHATRSTIGRIPRAGVIPSPVVYDASGPVHLPARVPSGSALRVAMVGRLAPWKGQDVFLEAFALAFAGGRQLAVIVGSAMFGEEDYAAELESLADRLGIAHQVVFTGFREDVDRLLDQVDCLVHASVIPEPFGQVVVEGMAAGLPVIASATGGPSEVITDGVDGLLCPPGDAAALAALLRRLADDPEERDRLGEGGRIRAGDFTPEVIAAQVRQVYEDLVAWGPPDPAFPGSMRRRHPTSSGRPPFIA